MDIDEKQVVEAIKQAEKQTSGEIRILIEKKCKDSPLDRAIKLFGKHKMHKTKDRNGILLYFASESKKMAIYGDEGIFKHLPSEYWETLINTTLKHFKGGDFTSGLTNCISSVGDSLKKYFPYQKDDKNELSDEIIYN